jgi:hypothetical protein
MCNSINQINFVDVTVIIKNSEDLSVVLGHAAAFYLPKWEATEMEVLMMTTSSPHISDSSLQNLEAFLQANMVIVSISMRAHIIVTPQFSN